MDIENDIKENRKVLGEVRTAIREKALIAMSAEYVESMRDLYDIRETSWIIETSRGLFLQEILASMVNGEKKYSLNRGKKGYARLHKVLLKEYKNLDALMAVLRKQIKRLKDRNNSIPDGADEVISYWEDVVYSLTDEHEKSSDYDYKLKLYDKMKYAEKQISFLRGELFSL